MEDNVRVVDRVFDIMEAICESSSPLTLSALSTRTGMSKSTLHRLLTSMSNRQYIEKHANNTYSIGYKLMETVSNHINSLELLTEAKPYLASLLRDLGLTSHLGILDGYDVIYLEKMDSFPTSRLYTQVGYRSPACCSSIGKVLFSCLSGDELEEALFDYQFPKYTPNTITSLTELKRVLRVVRKQGWAMDNEEYQLGHRCVAAPIFDYRGSPIAAISASGPIRLLADQQLENVIIEVKKAAGDISRRMGYLT